jgi:hypothetical protein
LVTDEKETGVEQNVQSALLLETSEHDEPARTVQTAPEAVPAVVASVRSTAEANNTERLETRLRTDDSEASISSDDDSTVSDASSRDAEKQGGGEEYEEDEFENVSDDDE